LTIRRTPIAREIVTTAGSLRHHGNGEGDSKYKHLQRGHSPPQSESKDDCNDCQGRFAQRRTKAVQIFLQGCAACAYCLDQAADASELGLHSGLDDDSLASSTSDKSTCIRHI
jgi:hypothetical protein